MASLEELARKATWGYLAPEVLRVLLEFLVDGAPWGCTVLQGRATRERGVLRARQVLPATRVWPARRVVSDRVSQDSVAFRVLQGPRVVQGRLARLVPRAREEIPALIRLLDMVFSTSL